MTDIAASITADIRQLDPHRESDPHYETPALLSRLYYATTISAVQGAHASGRWYKGWQEWFYPPQLGPDIVKSYDVKAHLPVRIFFPSNYDQTSPQTLPTLFTIHGGGFCIGDPDDDDRWNRTFADAQNVLIISLHYSKAPWNPFPGPLHDVGCLYLAAVTDASLPIDKSRVAVVGFSAGGNLALAVCQLPSIRTHAASPKAVIPIYPAIDLSRDPADKAKRRHYKVDSGLPGLRGQKKDWIFPLASVFDWAYVSPGTNLRHPLVSPFYADKRNLPGHIFVIGAELDFLVDEAHQFALRLVGRERDPLYNAMPGHSAPSNKGEGQLETEDQRFAWEEGGVRWLLVPDVVHAFDFHVGAGMAGVEAVADAEGKTEGYMRLVGQWLFRKVWV